MWCDPSLLSRRPGSRIDGGSIPTTASSPRVCYATPIDRSGTIDEGARSITHAFDFTGHSEREREPLTPLYSVSCPHESIHEPVARMIGWCPFSITWCEIQPCLSRANPLPLMAAGSQNQRRPGKCDPVQANQNRLIICTSRIVLEHGHPCPRISAREKEEKKATK